MKKLVINLDRRADRKINFLDKNSHIGDVSWIQAIDGKELTHQSLKQFNMSTKSGWRDPFFNRTINHGEVGCFLSHREAWLSCIKLGEPVLVLEDDAVFLDGYDEEYVEDLTNSYGIIFLGHIEQTPDLAKSIDSKLVVPNHPYNAHAYVITPETAKVLSDAKFMHDIIPTDDYLCSRLVDLNAVALKTDVVKQECRTVLHTDIEKEEDSGWFVDFKTHPVTIGTDRKKCIPLNDSAALHSVYPKNLGTNVEWKGTDMSGAGGGHKVTIFREYLNTLPDSDVVLFTDAYDVIYNADIQEITRRYLGFKKKVVFSAEQYIWPDKSLADKFPQCDTKYKYLNSGTFIGRVDELKRIVADSEIAEYEDDQLFYQKAFLSGKYDIALDSECYIFQTHDTDTYFEYDQKKVFNPITNAYSCIYHGNGGNEAKTHFDGMVRSVKQVTPMLYLPAFKHVDIIDTDMLVCDFMTQTQCEDLIDVADRNGAWEPLPGDKFPAQEIRMKELGMFQTLERHWEKNLYPIIEQYWRPMQMYGLRDAFVMRYAMDTQTSLSHHTDASLVTGSVKLNDDYEGADLLFHRQNISNKDIAVGRCILFPGMVTHGHECMELQKGVKYSLTMWTSRYQGDMN
ncbi:glycosyltransferase family 25 protein [bacterium]|nr:glycosyltransferase family 25 protein [bacterium]